MAKQDCLTRPKVEDIAACIMTEMSHRLLGGRNVQKDTSLEILAAVVAGAIFEVQGDIAKAYDQNYLDTMCCDSVERLAASLRIAKKAPARAVGYARLSGTAGTTIPAVMSFVSALGVEYELDPSFPNPAVLDSTGAATVRVRAALPGLAGNALTPTVTSLTLAASVAGISQTATLTGSGATGGADEETCEELRQRLIVRRQNACVAGNIAFYRNAILDYPGVRKVCLSGCKCQDCCDSAILTAYAFFDETTYPPYGVPPIEVARAIASYVWGDPAGAGHGLAPVGAYGRILRADPCLVTVRVYTQGSLNPQQTAVGQQAIVDFFDTITCVGATFCNAHLQSAIVRALPRVCIRRIDVCGDCIEIDSSGDVRFDCGSFPVVQTMSFINGTPPALPCT